MKEQKRKRRTKEQIKDEFYKKFLLNDVIGFYQLKNSPTFDLMISFLYTDEDDLLVWKSGEETKKGTEQDLKDDLYNMKRSFKYYKMR